MKPRTQRLLWIVLILAVLGTALALILNAFQSNLVFFFTPSQIASGEAPKGRAFRVGGLVQTGSVVRNGVDVSFVVTDQVHSVRVNYSGILPDLFKPGKGVVAQGKLQDDGRFVASEVLAKHDENYMPPEAAQALQQARLPNGGKPMQTGAPQ